MTKQEILDLRQKLSSHIVKETKPDYTYYQIKTDSMTITAYTSGKVVFQGQDLSWMEETESENNMYPQAGSDEVGTGDYFGPVVVAACIVSKEAAQKLSSLKIQDSKQIKDDQIRRLAPEIKAVCPHSILIVQNTKYNEVHQNHNMVDIKCRLHNQAYVNLVHKGYTLPDFIIIDQFVQKKQLLSLFKK